MPPRSRAVGVLILLWVAVAGPYLRALNLPASRPGQVLAVGLGASAAMVIARRFGWWVRVLIAATVAAFLAGPQGDAIALWMAAGLLLGTWVAFSAPPLPRLPADVRQATAPVVVLTAVAAWQGADEARTWQPFVPLALACAVPLLGLIGGGALHRAAAWLGERAGNAVSTIAFGLLSVPAVAVPWVAQRVLRLDPLALPGRGWTDRERRPLQAGQPWAADPSPHRPPLSTRARLPVAIAAIGALAFGTMWVQRSSGPDAPAAASTLLDGEPSSNGANADWYDEYREDIEWVLDERVAFRPFEVYRLLDVETRHVNIHDNRRDSWTAPACDCERLTVWLYGGSAVFGLEQRDEHTIASHLAKVAYEDGIVLDVHNRGIPGQMHWRTAFRFAWDLTNEPEPDLAVFYDGADEVDSALVLAERGLGDTRAPYEPFVERLYDEIFDVPEVPTPPANVEYLGWPTVSDAPMDRPGALAVLRYERTRGLSQETSATSGVPVAWFWQPTWHTRPSSERPEGGEDAAARAAAFAEASVSLPEGVTDLTEVFDDVEGPIFADEVHHDERGARLVAEAIYRTLRPQLLGLGEDGPG